MSMPVTFDDLLTVESDDPIIHKELIRPLSGPITPLLTPRTIRDFTDAVEPVINIHAPPLSMFDEESPTSGAEPTSRCETVTAPHSSGNPSAHEKTSHAVVKKRKATRDDVTAVKAKETVARTSSSFEQEPSNSKVKKDSRQNGKKEGEQISKTTKNSVAPAIKSTMAKARDSSTFKIPLQSTENRREHQSRNSDTNNKKTYDEDRPKHRFHERSH